MLYARISDNNEILEYPYDISSIQKEYPNVSFPSEMTPETLKRYSIVQVFHSEQPDLEIYRIINLAKPVCVDGKWISHWITEPIDNSEQIKYNDQKASVLNRRDQLLLECDWTQLKDVPNETSSKWIEYRKSLRDISTQEQFPFIIEWPKKPN